MITTKLNRYAFSKYILTTNKTNSQCQQIRRLLLLVHYTLSSIVIKLFLHTILTRYICNILRNLLFKLNGKLIHINKTKHSFIHNSQPAHCRVFVFFCISFLFIFLFINQWKRRRQQEKLDEIASYSFSMKQPLWALLSSLLASAPSRTRL